MPELSEAVKAYNKVTTSEDFMGLEWMLHKAERDEAHRLAYAEERGEKRAAAKWKKTVEEKDEIIEKLKNELEHLKQQT